MFIQLTLNIDYYKKKKQFLPLLNFQLIKLIDQSMMMMKNKLSKQPQQQQQQKSSFNTKPILKPSSSSSMTIVNNNDDNKKKMMIDISKNIDDNNIINVDDDDNGNIQQPRNNVKRSNQQQQRNEIRIATTTAKTKLRPFSTIMFDSLPLLSSTSSTTLSTSEIINENKPKITYMDDSFSDDNDDDYDDDIDDDDDDELINSLGLNAFDIKHIDSFSKYPCLPKTDRT